MTKTWFITGCSTGFGRLLVQELLATDAKVVATARNPDSLADLAAPNLLALPLDVTKPDTIAAAVTKAHAHFGSIDVLVNNAGYGILGALEETPMEAIRRNLETNLFGLIAVTQTVLPIMRKQGRGHIINMSSAAGVVPTAGFSTYNAAKYAVEGVSESLALEIAPLGLHVTLIEPGPFRTDFAGRSLDEAAAMPEYAESVGKTRAFMQDLSGKQAGDPVKAARILIQVAGMENPPLHLPLGHSAVDRIQAKLKAWHSELSQYETLARSADYDADTAKAS